ncbi:hypothetical protein LOTGIDRAFT_171808 [Lottia gigantea]|uniref:Lipoxygenase domain-containing protein n=1 Tax=Lottia gigantea TaxID=225164 RepID=V4AFD1_LOTGI|nr:hypothetical protein LOTGIDRAFT_171808 [Lottia gigantea]ESP02739.1 hypothetical protein LOTGIDRAFT_171808 [Lottia gigantea]
MEHKELRDLYINVSTGDKKYAGTDASVKIILHDNQGRCTKDIVLDNFFRNDFERGRMDVFHIRKKKLAPLGKIDKIEIWRDDAGLLSDWYVDRIVIEDRENIQVYEFPIFRWIKAKLRYKIKHLDTSLPQLDEHLDQRKMELEDKRKQYEICQKEKGLPVQWDIVSTKADLLTKSKIVKFFSGPWDQVEDVKNLYSDCVFHLPRGADGWKDDLYFANQRIASVNSGVIELCTAIPEKLAVTEEMLKPILEGNSLQYLLDNKRLFIIDFEILEGIHTKPDQFVRKEKNQNVYDHFNVCAPIALFMVDNNQQLRPIAIQLYQQPSSKNPVFLPSDHPNTWLLAKMWFNNADSTYHQALAHLGYTHLLMEGVTVATHRNLSGSHPLFKLLAPHFLYIIAINARGIVKLLAPGGWVDAVMNCGSRGVFDLIKKGIDKWRLDKEGCLPDDLKSRGLDDPNVLPGYHFRDDALLLYNAIQKYASEYVNLYYDGGDKIADDWELQGWGRELVMERESGGVGLKGLPHNGTFRTQDDIVKVVTCVIYTCSVVHAATNFPQYEEYGFPPNYPATFKGTPPTTKDHVDEKQILSCLPSKENSLDVMVVTKVLSAKGTNSLGDFELMYIADPNAKRVVEAFRADLKKISGIIKERNITRRIPYIYLDPEIIPNSISI